MFRPHPNLSDGINRNIIQNEIEGGVDLRGLPRMSTLEVETRNHHYVIVLEDDGEAWIAGHPEICPEPVLVRIAGSTWGGSMIRTNYLGRGMQMEFCHPGFPGVVVTSPIVDIKMLSMAA